MLVVFKRIIKSGALNFKRNAFISLTAVAVMIVTLTVIVGSLLFSAVLNATLEDIQQRVDVRVVFTTETSEEEILSIRDRVEGLPEVSTVSYTSREDALEQFRERHQADEVILQALAELDDNPLGASINIQAHDPGDYGTIAAWVADSDFNEAGMVESVNYEDHQEAIERLTQFMDGLERFGLISTVVLIVVSLLITFNTIRLTIYTSRDEIAVMRLVGASTGFIRGPFVVAGTLYGVIAAVVTLALFYPFTLWIGDTATGFIDINLFAYYVSNFTEIMFIVVGSGVVIGAVSSYVAVKRYLKI